jgi:hypothetical protein
MIRQLRLNVTLLPACYCSYEHNWQRKACCSGGHKPAIARTQDIGCWILADNPVGQLAKPLVFWHLDAYPTRVAAEADKGSRGTVIESFGKVWLMTIEDDNWNLPTETALQRLGRFRSSQEKNIRRSLWKRTSRPE